MPGVAGATGLLTVPASAEIFSLCLASLPAADPDTIWDSWSFAPQIALPIVIGCVLYARGRSRLASGNDPRCPNAIEATTFAVGMLFLGVAVLSPLCRMASTLAWAHMIQHAILVAIAPPLILLGRPGPSFAAALPTWRSLAHQSAPGARGPLMASVIYGFAIWFWHVPNIYQTALLNEGVHLLMYGSLLAVSFYFWHGIVEAVRTPGERSGLVAVTLLLTIIHTGLLGALLTFSQSLWYPLVSAGTGSWGISPFDDQELAGLIMWIPMGMIYLAAGLGPDVRRAVMSYLSERLDAAAVSTSECVKAVRHELPQCALDDLDIVDLVTEKAVDAGFAVSFDGAGTKT